MHRQTGEQERSSSCMPRSSSKSGAAANRHIVSYTVCNIISSTPSARSSWFGSVIAVHLALRRIVICNMSPALCLRTATVIKTQYVYCYSIRFLIMFYEIMILLCFAAGSYPAGLDEQQHERGRQLNAAQVACNPTTPINKDRLVAL